MEVKSKRVVKSVKRVVKSIWTRWLSSRSHAMINSNLGQVFNSTTPPSSSRRAAFKSTNRRAHTSRTRSCDYSMQPNSKQPSSRQPELEAAFYSTSRLLDKFLPDETFLPDEDFYPMKPSNRPAFKSTQPNLAFYPMKPLPDEASYPMKLPTRWRFLVDPAHKSTRPTPHKLKSTSLQSLQQGARTD